MDDSLEDIAAEFEKEFTANIVEDKSIIPETKEEPQKPGPSRVSRKTHCLSVNPKQKGNPILKFITNVPWEYDEIVPDYQMGQTTCALFLSLRYHNLNPDYIHERLKLLKKMYQLRVLLVQVDINDPHHCLKNLTRICILADMTLILAWSPEEAGKILETYKIYETKPADKIMEKSESSPHLKLVQALTSIKPVNKTDAITLISKFKTLKGILQASEYQLSECPGFGSRKAKKLYQTLHENFCR
ncbi:PREDICTED: DNA excision repair protein ERCC-1 [Nicrophorus vespilloides]|uniref:DNA excision repair protein ERCC-1 n=1 Tax=Nicrophorus vespilloides TaxID=110193 RepID=A0ABM1N0G1_NICVS|nr:PREDICTED: DNA excision repair protein ERCC-1 [Nicrophorus vespilloides]